MLKIKEGVDIAGIRPEMLLAINVCERIYDQYNIDFVITACRDGKHSAGSLHYVGLAIDCRSRDIATDQLKTEIVRQMRLSLGKQFDVVVERTHFHIEFQPK